ncbi:MAG: alkaline phosphatase D family protein [Bacteroidota bacterium]|nr:alkaline phosphatase D family protein [Bacteroidota bacterium]
MKKYILFLVIALNQSCDFNDTRISIAFGSCNDPNYNTSILPVLSRALDTVDFMIWLGDNIYLEKDEWNHRVQIEKKYQSIFGQSDFQEILNKSEHLAIWDDHDAGPNDCNSLSAGLETSMECFKEFWQPNYDMPHERSYYGSKIIQNGLVEFFFLDNRTFKVPIDSLRATLFGEEQLIWLEEAFYKSDAKVKIILMGGQFLNSAPTFENASVYASERQRLVDLFTESTGIPIILSGDRHHGEISKLLAKNGKSIFDVTASPLTAKSYPHHEEPNLYRTHTNTTETNHFGLLTIKINKEGVNMVDIKLIDSYRNVLFNLRETL